MSGVIETLPPYLREIFIETVGAINQELLLALQATDEPTWEQREAVMDILLDAFLDNLEPNDEPTEKGKLIDDALGAFNMRWLVDKRPPY